VQFSLPNGYTATARDIGADDALDADAHLSTGQSPLVQLTSGEHDPTVDAGVFQRASIGDRVWEDIDLDGLQDPGEPGVPGVVVSLYGPTGTSVDSVTTDDDGIYRFAGLRPGTWSVGVSNLPAGTTVTGLDSGLDIGTDDAVDSDVDPVTGRAAATQLTPGESDLGWDAGIHRSAPPAIPARSSASRFTPRGPCIVICPPPCPPARAMPHAAQCSPPGRSGQGPEVARAPCFPSSPSP
jgi:hypothetical protein